MLRISLVTIGKYKFLNLISYSYNKNRLSCQSASLFLHSLQAPSLFLHPSQAGNMSRLESEVLISYSSTDESKNKLFVEKKIELVVFYNF